MARATLYNELMRGLWQCPIGRHTRAGAALGVLILLWLGDAKATPSARGPRNIVSYELGVFLDEHEHELHGRGTIVFENRSSAALEHLNFHLYLNAFEHSETLFYRSPFSRARGGRLPQHWGGIDVASLRISGTDIDLWEDASPHSPGDPLDETSIDVPLPEPLEPGDALSLEISWASRLPDLVDRTGFKQDFHFAGQWFPKLAVLEPDGTWEAFTFHPHGEFYADFGRYDVVLNVPCNYVVGATGVQLASDASNERCTHYYRAENVHDFAWTAWPQFRQYREEIEGVRVHFLIPKGHDMNLRRTRAAVGHGLRFYGQHFGQYPYETLTVVHPPEFAAGAGGMEYPTLITTGGAWYSSWVSRAVEQVTLHELGHQWFYGLLASNEQRWPFLDEGLTSYADSLALDAMYESASGISLLGLDVSAMAYYRVLGTRRGHDVAIASTAREFPSFGHLGAIAYGRTATVLRTWKAAFALDTGALIGPYAREFRFRHPTPSDLLASVARQLDAEAAEHLRVALFERGWVDFAVASIESQPHTAAYGDLPDRIVDPRLTEPLHVGRALVVRRGNVQLPVEIELVDAAGGRTRQHWTGRGDTFEAHYEGDVPLVAAVVDPEFRVLLDDNLTNNAGSTEPRTAASSQGLVTLLAELLLHGLLP